MPFTPNPLSFIAAASIRGGHITFRDTTFNFLFWHCREQPFSIEIESVSRGPVQLSKEWWEFNVLHDDSVPEDATRVSLKFKGVAYSDKAAAIGLLRPAFVQSSEQQRERQLYDAFVEMDRLEFRLNVRAHRRSARTTADREHDEVAALIVNLKYRTAEEHPNAEPTAG